MVGVVLRWTGGRGVGVVRGEGGGGKCVRRVHVLTDLYFQRLGLVTRLLIKGN